MELKTKKSISNGVYIVIDPIKPTGHILQQLERIIDEKIAAIQIWDNPKKRWPDKNLIEGILELYHGPVLVNNHWQLMQQYPFDGVHFDTIPADIKEIEVRINRPFLKGLTLENDLSYLHTAEENGFDYVSFCSLFPSETADNCEIVQPETIEQCRKRTDMPIFLAGGINLNNVAALRNLPAEGIAVASSVMNAANPRAILQKYQAVLKY